jgi:xanthine/uracil/vitamin C permease (AzgA family)
VAALPTSFAVIWSDFFDTMGTVTGLAQGVGLETPKRLAIPL